MILGCPNANLVNARSPWVLANTLVIAPSAQPDPAVAFELAATAKLAFMTIVYAMMPFGVNNDNSRRPKQL